MHLLNKHKLSIYTKTYLNPQNSNSFKLYTDKNRATKFPGRSLRQKAPLRDFKLLSRNR
jgi:hypothetical protein